MRRPAEKKPDAFALCTRERVEITAGEGEPVEVDAWRFGDLAVTPRVMAFEDGSVKPAFGFTITHLPTGMSFASAHCNFATPEDAVAAMMEISRLKNTWQFLSADELPALGPKIAKIALARGGSPAPHGREGKIEETLGRNGYQKDED